MTKRVQEVLSEVLELEHEEQMELARSLLDHLSEGMSEDAELLAELERRDREAENDPSMLVPAEEVFRRIREKYVKGAE
jgi:putative addiction module component (TIGR02574 family)